MRRASATAVLLAALACCASVAAQDTPYNATETFQPGKKYNCVPAADHKSWNCNEIGKADATPHEPANLPPPSAAPTPSRPETKTPAAPPPPASTSDRASSLPNYLTNAAASSNAPPAPPPSTISATANHANEPPISSTPASPPPVVAKPAPQKPPAAAAAKPAPQKLPPAVSAKSAPHKLPAPTREPPGSTTSANGGFMDLAGDHFVIELAHAARRSDLAAARDAIHVPRGDLYELHFRQNGADAWLLLWGSFDSIEAARAARSELAQSASAAIGWPRRVAPLQAEARRVSP